MRHTSQLAQLVTEGLEPPAPLPSCWYHRPDHLLYFKALVLNFSSAVTV